MRRSRSAVLALLLVLPVLGFVPPAAAQDGAWKIDDPAGDVYVGSSSMPPLVPTPVTNHMDIRSVTIDGEDEASIDLTIKVENMRIEPRKDPGGGFSVSCGGGWSSGGSGARIQFEVEFARPDSPFRYIAFVRLLGESGPSGFVVHSALGLLCIHSQPPSGGSVWQTIPVTLEPNLVHVNLLKSALMGQLPSPEFPSTSPRAAKPPALRPGDRFTDFVATSSGAVDTLVCCFMPDLVQDIAPNTGKGPAYTLKARTANSVIRIDQSTMSTDLALAPGNQSSPFLVSNLAEAKRLIRLSYAVDGPDAERIKITGPAAITVPGQDVKNFSVAIDVTGTSPFDPATRIRIGAESTGYPDELGLLKLGLVFGEILGPKANTVYLHGSNELEGLSQSTGEACVVLFGTCRRGFMSSLESDPSASKPDEFGVRLGPGMGGGVARGYVGPMATTMPTSVPLAFGAGQPTLLELKFASAQAVDLQVRAILSYSTDNARYVREQTNLGEGTGSGSTGTVIKVSVAAPSNEVTTVPRGQFLRLQLDITAPASPGAAAMLASGLRIVGKESKIILPLVEAEGLEASVQGTFQLRLNDDGQEFVNPGEARLINVTVLNQAPDNRTARLSLLSSLAGWRTEVLPGAVFTLGPGDSILVGVRVHAPTTAKEGEQSTVWLNVTDEAGKPSSMRLGFIATSGVDLPDDAGEYEADSDAKAKLQAAAPERSPAAGLVFAIFALVLVGLARTRVVKK